MGVLVSGSFLRISGCLTQFPGKNLLLKTLACIVDRRFHRVILAWTRLVGLLSY